MEKRVKRIYRVCPHCEKQLNLKIFREHKKLHYNLSTKLWTKTVVGDKVSSGSDTSSSFELTEQVELRRSSEENTSNSTDIQTVSSSTSLHSESNLFTEANYNMEDTCTANSSMLPYSSIISVTLPDFFKI